MNRKIHYTQARWNDGEHRLIAFGEELGGATESATEVMGATAETAENFSSSAEGLNDYAGSMVDNGVNTASSASNTLNGSLDRTVSFCGQFNDVSNMTQVGAAT